MDTMGCQGRHSGTDHVHEMDTFAEREVAVALPEVTYCLSVLATSPQQSPLANVSSRPTATVDLVNRRVPPCPEALR